MSSVVQLIINGIQLPKTSRDRYSYDTESEGAGFKAISGRRYFEESSKCSVVKYSYDYLGDSLHKVLMPLLRSTGELTVSYLNDVTGLMSTEIMYVASYKNPTFAFTRAGKPYYHGYGFVLKGVYPLVE